LWNSITKSNGYCHCYGDSNCNSNRYCNGNRYRNSNRYSYTKTHSNSEIPSLTETASDPAAASVTEFLLGEFNRKRTRNVILGSFNQEKRNPSPGTRIPAFLFS